MFHMDVWIILSVSYAFRVVGLRTEFYKMAAEDPVVEKMMLPTVEKSQDMITAEDMKRSFRRI